MRFINAAPGYDLVDLCVSSVAGYYRFARQAFDASATRPSLTSGPNPRTVVVMDAGHSTVLASAQIPFAIATEYTLVFTKHSTKGGLLLLVDTVSAPPPGDVSFRFVNASPSVGPVDVYVTTGGNDLNGLTPAAANLPFEAGSPYVVSPAGFYRIIVTAAGHPGTVLFDIGGGVRYAGEASTAVFGDTPPRLRDAGYTFPLVPFTMTVDRAPDGIDCSSQPLC